MEIINKLLSGNRNWVNEKLKVDDQFFHRLAEGQKPEVLWIGCSDSRAPANEVTGTKAGDIFVHRNKDVYRIYEDELEAIEDEEKRFDRFVELNVYEQVFDLSKTSIIQNAWESRNEPKLHGWVIDISTGLIKDLGVSLDNKTQISKFYKIDSGIVLS